MKASIISVGAELLVGKTLDTNSYYLSQQLQQFAIDVVRKYTVGDDITQISNTLSEALQESDLVLTTGGLGPTLDDITRDAVALCTGRPLTLDTKSEQKIHKFFQGRGIQCTGNNLKQAFFPEGSTILDNKIGTAPGFITSCNSKMIIVLPGPPKEMQQMFENSVIPLLEKISDNKFETKYIQIFGIGESTVEDRLLPIIQKLPSNISLATYVSDGFISLRVSARHENQEKCKEILLPVIHDIGKILGDYIFSMEGESLEEVIGNLLLKKGLTLSVAESCTGGLLSARITSIPGISASFERGIITYSNEAKMNELGIPKGILQQHGAVSSEIALAMLKGLKEKTKTDCCISITGIAGPGGATKNKPVGLVYIGINVLDEFNVYEFRFKGNRSIIQNRTTLAALNLLRKNVINLQI